MPRGIGYGLKATPKKGKKKRKKKQLPGRTILDDAGAITGGSLLKGAVNAARTLTNRAATRKKRKKRKK